MLKLGVKHTPRKWVANQAFDQPTMSLDRQDGSYKGSSAQKIPREIPVFVPNTNRSSGPLK